MSVFHGDWNEDLKEFLDSYLQCTAAGGNNFRARQFINYLGVYSDAEDWFEELPQEEKKDWVAIELSFHKRWLKEEVLRKQSLLETNPIHCQHLLLSQLLTQTLLQLLAQKRRSQHLRVSVSVIPLAQPCHSPWCTSELGKSSKMGNTSEIATKFHWIVPFFLFKHRL